MILVVAGWTTAAAPAADGPSWGGQKAFESSLAYEDRSLVHLIGKAGIASWG
jgi:hypothetical protein